MSEISIDYKQKYMELATNFAELSDSYSYLSNQLEEKRISDINKRLNDKKYQVEMEFKKKLDEEREKEKKLQDEKIMEKMKVSEKEYYSTQLYEWFFHPTSK
jgi:transcriptional regulator of heat shock response